eukprot:2122532-Alexandrium_andersonii.AAC.1
MAICNMPPCGHARARCNTCVAHKLSMLKHWHKPLCTHDAVHMCVCVCARSKTDQHTTSKYKQATHTRATP